jgi:Family of unknown function (DUF5765)
MCFTLGMSVVLGTVSFAWAIHEWFQYRCLQYSLGIGYWGVMELLQAVQHLYAAGPEDDYAMCANRTNQMLTDLAAAHIVFQPLFVSMLLMSMYRRHDITARIEADLIFNLTLAGAFWYVLYPWYCELTNTEQMARQFATPECPNYMWLGEGYDGYLGQTTPNLLHKPCTYYAPTKTNHLAWVVPSPRQNYVYPSGMLKFMHNACCRC